MVADKAADRAVGKYWDTDHMEDLHTAVHTAVCRAGRLDYIAGLVSIV